MGRYVVGMTGASGAAYGRRLVEVLALAGHRVELLVTAAGFPVRGHELDWEDRRYGGEGGLAARCARFFCPEGAPGEVRLHPIGDVLDELGSGSQPTDGTVVVPCTMGRISAFATGRSQDLLDRAVDVTLKEGRTLIVVPRETPLSLIHLRNLTALAEAGAVVLPAMPGFYHQPRSIPDIVDFLVARIVARLGLPQELLPPWQRPR